MNTDTKSVEVKSLDLTEESLDSGYDTDELDDKDVRIINIIPLVKNENKELTPYIYQNDEEKLTLTVRQASLSKVFRAALKDKDAKEITIECEYVILKYIVDYLKHHDGVKGESIEKPLKSLEMKNLIKNEFDVNFIENLSKNDLHLYRVLLSASYLDIPCLSGYVSAKFASYIKSKGARYAYDFFKNRFRIMIVEAPHEFNIKL